MQYSGEGIIVLRCEEIQVAIAELYLHLQPVAASRLWSRSWRETNSAWDNSTLLDSIGCWTL